jgi:hypothetical protein
MNMRYNWLEIWKGLVIPVLVCKMLTNILAFISNFQALRLLGSHLYCEEERIGGDWSKNFAIHSFWDAHY